jgi:hypothetical protein
MKDKNYELLARLASDLFSCLSIIRSQTVPNGPPITQSALLEIQTSVAYPYGRLLGHGKPYGISHRLPNIYRCHWHNSLGGESLAGAP